ncbi:hypothetical protein [Legionella sainthelensi]|uniref:Uncharacterized protein n=1 Tax=Legionella sainthelensi TaxID=28087 RepID=A0A2H5FPR2_9GAMM|nr:hypothetical protein [Legionella sainthelensi]AUH73564.1 hypothetical protein CAB17_17050 [Legionella sainthelensi]
MSYSSSERQNTNLTIFSVWLNSNGDLDSDLQKAEKYLQNMGNFILSNIDFTPLEFAQKMETKLQKMLSQKKSAEQEERINECINKLEGHKKYVKLHVPNAEKQADKLIAQYKNITDIKEECLKEMLYARPKLNKARDLFIKVAEKTNKEQSIFQRSINNYQLLWDELSNNIKKFQDLVKKYPDNQLAKLLNEDNISFVNDVVDGNISLDGELGALALQRLLSEYSKFSNLQKANIATFLKNTEIERVTHCDESALKSEIIKLHLYAKYCQDNNLPLVAWIGSARPVFSMIADHPGKGAYLNCDDAKWSAELNSTWLLIVSGLGYEIKLVEQHFPNVAKAIESGNIFNYISAIANEMRPNTKQSHSQYHGGDQPTATPQEILRLMSIGCTAKKNEDGSISLMSPKKAWVTEDYRSNTIKNEAVEVSKTRRHSVTFFKSAPQPVKKSLFEHPGKSEDIRKDDTPKV